MSFRARLTLVAAAAVALAVVAASVLVYVVVRNQLYGSVDDALRSNMERITHGPPFEIGRGPPQPGVFGGYPQIVPADGPVIRPSGQSVTLPVTDRMRDVADGGSGTFLSDAHVSGTHVRLITFQYAPGYAIEVARSLEEADHSLSRIKLLLILIAGGGILVAAGLGTAVSGAALAPVRRLTKATETVTETGDLSERIDTKGRDELSRLAASFNTMLGAL